MHSVDSKILYSDCSAIANKWCTHICFWHDRVVGGVGSNAFIDRIIDEITRNREWFVFNIHLPHYAVKSNFFDWPAKCYVADLP